MLGVEAVQHKAPAASELESAVKLTGVKWTQADVEDFCAALKKIIAHARTLQRKALNSTSSKIAILKKKIQLSRLHCAYLS
jgi:hypothetical protein